jgi:hypothetical protein
MVLAVVLCVCRYDRQLLGQVEAAAQEQRLRQGLVRSTVLGPQRAREALVAARDHITSLLKHMVDEVERNHATQVGARGAASTVCLTVCRHHGLDMATWHWSCQCKGSHVAVVGSSPIRSTCCM